MMFYEPETDEQTTKTAVIQELQNMARSLRTVASEIESTEKRWGMRTAAEALERRAKEIEQ